MTAKQMGELESEENGPIVIVHWPGKDTPACPRHLEKLVGLGAVLGIQITWSLPLGDTPECSNCETEKKRQVERIV